MRIHPLSFLLGLGAAALYPLISRVLRPLAVEAAAAGMGIFEEGRRLFAEQMELVEDLAAEARARREQLVQAQSNGNTTGNGNAASTEGSAAAPRRRRRNGARASTDVA